MSKLVLLSIVIAMITVPTRAARDPNPGKGMRKVIIRMLAFELFYAFLLVYVWGRW